MDFGTFLTLPPVVLIPVLIYFLFFKKNDGRSVYTGRDVFYPIKYHLAKKVTTKAQRRAKKTRLEKEVESKSGFFSQQGSCYQSYAALDQRGNGLKLKLVLKPNKVAEAVLVLHLANGKVYTFPGTRRMLKASVKDYDWKINGLSIECLEPYRRTRIVFNGLLQDARQEIEHVQFSFIFSCVSAPQFYPEDCDASLLAETLATIPWRNASWKRFIQNHPKTYEQFGSLVGFVKGDCLAGQQTLNLPACRTWSEGPNEAFPLDREVKIFLAETNGVLISLTLQSLKNHQSQLNYGYVCHKDYQTVPITGQDIRIQTLGQNRVVPALFIAHVQVKGGDYTCVFHVNNNQASRATRWECFNLSAKCDVNLSRGWAFVELDYYSDDSANPASDLRPIITSEKPSHDNLPKDYTVNIRSKEARILQVSGGKGNSLALLTSIDTDEFLVPYGFIVTTNAFKYHLSRNDVLQDAVASIDDVFCGRNAGSKQEVCASAVQLLTNEPIDSQVTNEILKELDSVQGLSSNVGSWAVRSSAVGEDSEELSAAGQNETILGCVGQQEILKAISKCWASLYSYQSVQYRWQHGMPIIADMAVVVQQMIPAEAAGVLFTWHPTTSNPSQMVVTSNFGLGESVVSGTADPDTFILKRTYDGQVSLLEKTMGNKDKVLLVSANGRVETSTAFDDQEDSFVIVGNHERNKNRWSLSDDEILQLGNIGVKLETIFGGPRDIEWAFSKGNLYLLQSRPITTLNDWTDFELTHELDSPVLTENSLYTTANCGEVFSIAVSALSRTTVMMDVDAGIQSYLRKDANSYFLKGLCTFQYRVLLDCCTTLYSMERGDEIQMATKVLDLAIFGHPVINEKINLMVRKRLGPPPRLLALKETLRRWLDSRKLVEAVQKAIDCARGQTIDVQENDDLWTIYQKVVSKTDLNYIPPFYHSYATSTSVFWQMLCMMVLVGDKKELTLDHCNDFANILSSCEDVESAEVPQYLENIARIIREGGSSEEFRGLKPEQGVEWLETKCPKAFEVFEEFLKRHGHRCVGEFDLIEETWELNPSKVIAMIQLNVKHVQATTRSHKSIDEVVDNLTTPLNFGTRRFLKYALSKLRVAVGKREQSKSALVLSIHKQRLVYRLLAKKLAEAGFLPSESLIFHLTAHELGELIRTRNPLLVTKAVRRQKLYPKWNNLRFPELCYGIPEPEMEFNVPIELVPGSKCTGTPVCTGNIRGRACVILHFDEIAQLEKGDILITHCTDIGWSPYFPMLGGVVTELGGLVSHGAVVAREYGLPCIVGVKNATKSFKTGDMVFLSGETGEIGKI